MRETKVWTQALCDENGEKGVPMWIKHLGNSAVDFSLV